MLHVVIIIHNILMYNTLKETGFLPCINIATVLPTGLSVQLGPFSHEVKGMLTQRLRFLFLLCLLRLFYFINHQNSQIPAAPTLKMLNSIENMAYYLLFVGVLHPMYTIRSMYTVATGSCTYYSSYHYTYIPLQYRYLYNGDVAE